MNMIISRYFLMNPNKLIPTEEVDEEHVLSLEKRILEQGVWTTPIYIHKDALFVMDGHHRLTVAKRLQLDLIPVMLMDYDTVEVTAWREGEIITPHRIFAMARSGGKFPIKTTRHIFKGPKPTCAVSLDDLKYTPITAHRAVPMDGAGYMMTSS